MLPVLPDDLKIADLEKQVSALQVKVAKLDPGTLSRLKPFHIVIEPNSGDQPQLRSEQAQRVVARDYGFSSWDALLQVVGSDAPRTEPSTDQLASEFLRLVVLVYSEIENHDPQRFGQAADLLRQHPNIADHSIYMAAAMGDVPRLQTWIQRNPELINARGGHHDWEPLMYAAYSRFPQHSTLAAGVWLLEQGADANAHYMWGGQYKFTALTGVFGQGEGGPVNLPEHPDTQLFARALLQAGANPNDSQAAYNRMFTTDNLCLELLLEFGINQRDRNNWLLCDNDKLISHPDETLHYQLMYAVRKNYQERVELLLKHGVDVNRAEEDAHFARTPVEAAMLSRHDKLAELLLANGATPANFDAVDQFYIAVQSADASAANALLTKTPNLAQLTQDRFPGMLEVAVDANDPEALQLMLSLGFDANAGHSRSALHQAAFCGSVDLLKLLIAAGGDTRRRDIYYYSPPLGWALHNNQPETIAFLETCDVDIFTAAVRGLDSVIKKLVAEEPACLSLTFSEVRPAPERYCAGDWMSPLAFAIQGQHPNTVELLLQLGADPSLISTDGETLQSLAQQFVTNAEKESSAARNAQRILELLSH